MRRSEMQVVDTKAMIAQGFGLGGFRNPGLKVTVNHYDDGSIEIKPWPGLLGETTAFWLRPAEKNLCNAKPDRAEVRG